MFIFSFFSDRIKKKKTEDKDWKRIIVTIVRKIMYHRSKWNTNFYIFDINCWLCEIIIYAHIYKVRVQK